MTATNLLLQMERLQERLDRMEVNLDITRLQQDSSLTLVTPPEEPEPPGTT
jgi:hypothetical protein